jgi:DNA-binding transcriptional ArsR family regulator
MIMESLQEMISRGRFIFSRAPRRFEVFKLINGKLNTKEIAKKVGRSHSSVLQDMEKLRDFGLISEKRDKEGKIVKKEKCIVYEKAPLVKHINYSYFQDIANTVALSKRNGVSKKGKTPAPRKIHMPTENEILDICRHGEDQLYEFKSPGTATHKIAKEVAAFVHTKNGGIIFYGIDDDGGIIGSDLRFQEFDQKIQNSIRNTISPQPKIKIKRRVVMGSGILLIAIPPWDRKTIFQYTKDERYYVRKGTNIFALKPEEIKKLSKGEFLT